MQKNDYESHSENQLNQKEVIEIMNKEENVKIINQLCKNKVTSESGIDENTRKMGSPRHGKAECGICGLILSQVTAV